MSALPGGVFNALDAAKVASLASMSMPEPTAGDAEDARTFTVTLGTDARQTNWRQHMSCTWPDWAVKLTSHEDGRKEGSCITPAVFTGSSRKKEEAAQIDVAFLDSDSGMPLTAIQTALEALGIAAVISSTHSHMTTLTKAKRSHWDRFFAANPDATAADFLRIEKHYVAAVCEGAEPIESDDEDYVLIRHQPCPKFRVALPLAGPWVAADYPSQSAANAAWKERIEALAAALRLDHDQSCTDTSRLFYLPRRPPNGAPAETAIINGTLCDIFALPAAPPPDSDDLFTAPGASGKLRQQTDERPEYIDAITGEIIDLARWARSYGGRFKIAAALKARKPGVFTGHVDGAKVHIDCPNGDAHTDPGRDNATYVVNAGQSATKGFVVHCRHAHCTGQDRVFFVKRMLEQGWLAPDDLTDARFLLNVVPPPADDRDEPAGDWTSDVPPGDAGKSKQDARVRFNIINPVNLQGGWIPPREWVVEDWLPIGTVTANYGDGGTGKTLLAQQLMTSTAMGAPWCGLPVMRCRSFALFCEDDEAEMHRRQDQINQAMGCNFSDLSDMRWVSGVGEDNTLLSFDNDGMIKTDRLEAVVDAAKAFGARLVVLDTAADLFGGNENDRHQVRQFISVLTKVAVDINGAVLLNAHPSRSGISSGNLDGGSTAWSNSVRSRWSLARPPAADGDTEDPDARILTRRKANYARIGEDISLRWVNGALLPPGGFRSGASAIDRAAADVVFMDLLAKRAAQGVYVSHSTRAGNYAPKVFGKCADRHGYSTRDFVAAMGRLFDAKRIVAETYGRSSDMRQRIAAVA